MFESIIDFINIFSINIAIIISSVLTYYFISLNSATKKVNSNLSFISFEPGVIFTSTQKILSGAILGVITFFLYYNHIPAIGASFGIDMSYALIYLVIIYGTITQGITSMLVLEVLKSGYRLSTNQGITPMTWLNGLIFSCIIVTLSCYLKYRNYSIMRTHLIFVGGLLLLRLTFFSFYLNSFFNPKKITEFVFHLIVYTAVFFITTVIINITISLSQSVQIYQTAAITDELTGVYNRSAFNFFIDYISNPSEEKEHYKLSLSIIDVDKFKQINDKYGHPVGDQILKFVCQQMQSLYLPGQHYICRIGGDEFAIIHYQDIDKAEQFYQNLFNKIERNPYTIKDEPILFSLSVGLTHYNKTNFDSHKLIEESDQSLYSAKKEQGNSIVVSNIN